MLRSNIASKSRAMPPCGTPTKPMLPPSRTTPSAVSNAEPRPTHSHTLLAPPAVSSSTSPMARAPLAVNTSVAPNSRAMPSRSASCPTTTNSAAPSRLAATDRANVGAQVFDDAEELVPGARPPLLVRLPAVRPQIRAAHTCMYDAHHRVRRLLDTRVRDLLDSHVTGTVEDRRAHGRRG